MTSKPSADLSLNASWIVPVVPKGRIFHNCSLLIKDDAILGITPTDNVNEQYAVEKHIDLGEQLLMPGLINCHGHAAMSLLRGYADDLPLDTWLKQHIWPAETRWVNEDFVADGTRLAIAEMLLSGTTCFSDMYFFPETAARIARDTGMRCQITFPVLDLANNWSRDADDAIHKGLQLRDKYRSHPRVEIGFGPHAPYTVSDAGLRRIATYAEELQAPVQIHLHENASEISACLESSKKRPLERLNELGLISPLTQCVHMTQLDKTDLDILKTNGAHVIHCPQSNMKLASGTCPSARLLAEGINVALGTDGAASNNDLDMFAELQTAALLGKHAAGNPAAVDAQTALEMATINGAKAMGIEHRTGSLEVGKQADIIAIDFSSLPALPLYHPLSQLVYTGSGSRVSNVWVAGEQLVNSYTLAAKIGPEEIKNAALKWQNTIQTSGGQTA